MPTILHPRPVQLPTVYEERAEKRRRKRVVQELLETFECLPEEPAQEPAQEPVACCESKEMLTKLKEENTILKEKVRELELKNLELSALETDKGIIHQDQVVLDIKQRLKDVLTANQIDMALGIKKRVNWSDDDISKAFALRYFSLNCYNYLRTKANYPLPSNNTLLKWSAMLEIKRGFFNKVLNIMDICGRSMTELERVCVIEFDEMSVAKTVEYDQKADKVVGPHKNMQVMMVRGLFAGWKQAIFAEFDYAIQVDTIEKAAKKLQDAGFKVAAIVSDCGGSNQGLWKRLGAEKGNNKFKITGSSDDIFVFADAPHLLKLIRNWLIKTGFVLKSGKVITKRPLVKLIAGTRTEISSLFKITERHVNPDNILKQNVALAAQLLSHTTATALRQYMPDDDEAQELAKILQTCNDWFDVLNSRSTLESLDLKKPFGLSINIQIQAIEEMNKFISTTTCFGKKDQQVFQKAILMTNKSLLDLYELMKQKYNIRYIVTKHLNQDCLESYFGHIRSKGGMEDHPTPLKALSRMKLISLGKQMDSLKRNVNSQESGSVFLLADCLKKAAMSPRLDEVKDDQDFTDSSISSRDSGNTGKAEFDGIEYIAGYVAKVYKKKHSWMGSYSYKLKEDDTKVPSWVMVLSRGGLIVPSSKWLELCKKMNTIFEKYHTNCNFKRPQLSVVGRLTRKMIPKLVDELDKEIIERFVRLRTKIRCSYMTSQLKLDELNKKRARKMKKLN